MSAPSDRVISLYDEGAERLLPAADAPDRVSLIPGKPDEGGDADSRLRILWGQSMLPDLLCGRYRAVVCGVNSVDNGSGIISNLVELSSTSQWTAGSVTSYAKMFSESIGVHAPHDREPYVLKYDLDSMLILALLRPQGRDHFTLDDLSRGFQTITKMLHGRRERLPVATVSFLGARSNRLVTSSDNESEPSLEAVSRTMFEAGFRGDLYPPPQLWAHGDVSVFPSYPFPAGLKKMREGGD